jgi:transglutaminase-like putative cysteine protease/predicted glutamine amidotransferase
MSPPTPSSTPPSLGVPASAPNPAIKRQEHQLTRLLALSFDGAASPSIRLAYGEHHKLDDSPYGWGFAWYPEQTSCALVIKDPTSKGENAMTKVLSDWERFESTVFVCHLRGAARTIAEQDTQPFSKSYAGRDFVLAHNGDLFADLSMALPLRDDPTFEPIGRTDSEHAFSWLLSRMRAAGARKLSQVGWPRLHQWLRELDELGTANFLLTDGIDLCAYRDAEGYNGLGWMRGVPPYEHGLIETEDFSIDLQDVHDRGRSFVMVSTRAVGALPFTEIVPGQMVVFRRGALMHDSSTGHSEGTTNGMQRTMSPAAIANAVAGSRVDSASSEPPAVRPLPPSLPPPPIARAERLLRPAHLPVSADARVLSVVHDTVYRYVEEVRHSLHSYRLRPCHDLGQQVLAHDLMISVDGARREFEDVFGNAVTRLDLETPYRELRIISRSIVVLSPPRTPQLMAVARRSSFPLVWMPWQRQMMTPYLLPPELPETQLTELSEFAMSFAERQENDLVRTLLDMNLTIQRDFAYVSGSTTLETTPFDVYISRRGVCQDFANLLICLARLLGVPARYRVGYIFTGAGYENKIQSDASHAWAELYLPHYGWQGFDPTNGCLVGLDHIRVAAGRNYRDATPTSGTIYKGGGAETMTIDVRVEEA